ncbi:MAG: lipoyl(octanoyl) transferase LipB [Bdellovibrionales bacterium]|nr:lipoyl(octanoyl) transferase LipB [Bdellovibrionales bacterium]
MASNLIDILNSKVPNSDINLIDNIIIITKYKWDYLEALDFQQWCCDYIYANPNISIFIITNHLPCFTIGRGLQRNSIESDGLIEFDYDQEKRFTIPLYKIKRGGGITFHHSNQLVIYPIVNLTQRNMRVYDLMEGLLKIIVEVLQNDFKINDLDYCRKLLGLWHGDKKLASIGLQVRRFVTMHGVAVNIGECKKVQENLPFVHPCGLSSSIYTSLNKILDQQVFPEKFGVMVSKRLSLLLK